MAAPSAPPTTMSPRRNPEAESPDAHAAQQSVQLLCARHRRAHNRVRTRQIAEGSKVSNQPETEHGGESGDGGTQNFVVGADASPESKAAIEWTRSVAGADDRIALLSAWQVPVVAGYDMVVTVDPQAIERSAGQAVADQIERCNDPRRESVVCQGHSGKALVTEAEQRKAAMVVVGHRGNSRVSKKPGTT